jgi:alpha/beta superfamily hydrolase
MRGSLARTLAGGLEEGAMESKREERQVAIPMRGGALVLDGIYVPGAAGSDRGAVIAPPHPLHGGSMGSPVVTEIAWACARAGLATLRFDWRGVGGSAGAPSGEAAGADEDYVAALEQLAESVGGALCACGYSFGAAAALRAAGRSRRVREAVLVAPPPSLIDVGALGDARRVLVVAGEEDALAAPDALRALVAPSRNASLVLVPGADHFFGAGLAEVGRAVARWLAPATAG